MQTEVEEGGLLHDQEMPVIAVCLNFEALTDELVKLYGAKNNSRMLKIHQKGRPNLNHFLSQNNKRYFCIQTSVKNE